MSRALLNDERVSRRIAADFVPVSGGIERLQPSRYGWPATDSSRWFEPMARKAFDRFAPKGWWEQFQTYQGLYVAGPDGRPYAYRVVWELPPEELLKTLDAALEEHRKRPPDRIEIPDKTVERAAPPAADASTSVIRVTSRVRDNPAQKGIGRDHLWIFAAEAREIARGVLPPPILARLVRFHLLDHTRNIGVPYGEKDVSRAQFALKGLREKGGVRTFALAGSYAAERFDDEQKEKVGVEGMLEGEIDVDVEKSKIVRFRLYGEATAWGDVKRTGAPEGRYKLVFALVEADDALARSVPPVWHSLSPIWTPLYTNPKLALGK